MLSLPAKAFRIKAAVALAALYGVCILAPSVAFAFSNNPAVARCLTESHVGVYGHGGQVHVHADGTAHRHHDGGTSQSIPATTVKPQIAAACFPSLQSPMTRF